VRSFPVSVRPSLLSTTWFATSLAAALVVSTASAEAPRPAALAWTHGPGAESCIGGPELARAVDARLRRPALVPLGAAEIVVHGRIERVGERWQIAVTIEDPSGKQLGTRELVKSTVEAPDCRSLDADLGLVVALTIDPDGVASLPDSGAISSSSSAPPAPVAPTFILQREPVAPPSPPPLLPTVPPAPAAAPALQVAVEGGAVLASGVLPSTVFGGRARLGARLRPPVWIEVGAVVLADSDARAPGSPPGARLGLAHGTLAGCPELYRRASISALVCGGLALGTYQVTGFGVDEPRSDDRLYADASLAGRVRVRAFGPLHLFLGAGLQTPFVRDSFGYVDKTGARQRLFRARPVATLLELGIGFRFPE
jgi:hypothetical protein